MDDGQTLPRYGLQCTSKKAGCRRFPSTGIKLVVFLALRPKLANASARADTFLTLVGNRISDPTTYYRLVLMFDKRLRWCLPVRSICDDPMLFLTFALRDTQELAQFLGCSICGTIIGVLLRQGYWSRRRPSACTERWQRTFCASLWRFNGDGRCQRATVMMRGVWWGFRGCRHGLLSAIVRLLALSPPRE